ncbi:hypothetical protein L905_22535 [Agrobacterium sp. TS43]|nr:hypothetical protein L905_22535 [Agrobacterium sp. TS43]
MLFSSNFAKKQISRTGFQKGGRDGEIKSPVLTGCNGIRLIESAASGK